MCLKILAFIFIVSQMHVYSKQHQTFKRILGKNEIAGSHFIKDIHGTGSVNSCIVSCKSNSQCWSIGYQGDGDTCRLLSTILDETLVKGTDLGWIYFVMTGTCVNSDIVNEKSCYYFGDDTKRTFNESQTICNSRGGNLVHINDKKENDFIMDIVTQKDTETWIGLSDELEEGTWTWVPLRTAVTYTAWRPGQPDAVDTQNCAFFYKDHYSSYLWHDVSCQRNCSFICEKKLF